MATLHCHVDHTYIDRSRATDYRFQADGIYNVPDDVADYMLAAHPTKFCRAEVRQIPSCRAGTTVCSSSYTHREVVQPPSDKQMVVGRHKGR